MGFDKKISMCAMHKMCRKNEITVRGRLGLMKQSDLDTSVNQKRLTPQKSTDASWYSYDTITHRSVSFQPAEAPEKHTCRWWCHTLWKLSLPPGQPRLHPFCILDNLDLFQWPSHLVRFINLRIMQDTVWPLEQGGLLLRKQEMEEDQEPPVKGCPEKPHCGSLPKE